MLSHVQDSSSKQDKVVEEPATKTVAPQPG